MVFLVFFLGFSVRKPPRTGLGAQGTVLGRFMPSSRCRSLQLPVQSCCFSSRGIIFFGGGKCFFLRGRGVFFFLQGGCLFLLGGGMRFLFSLEGERDMLLFWFSAGFSGDVVVVWSFINRFMLLKGYF